MFYPFASRQVLTLSMTITAMERVNDAQTVDTTQEITFQKMKIMERLKLSTQKRLMYTS